MAHRLEEGVVSGMPNTPPSPVSRWRSIARLLALTTVLGAVTTSQMYFGIHSENPEFTWTRAAVIQLPFWYGWALLVPVIGWTTRRLTPPRVLTPETRSWAGRAAIHFVLAVVFSVVHSVGTMSFQHLLGFHPNTPITFQMYSQDALFRLSTNLLAYGAVVGIVYATDFYRRYRERELLASQLSAQLAQARLSALRMQLNPHFLFNSMNTIAMQVRKAANDDAVRMLAGLSELLRYMLEDSRPPEVPLSEELAFAQRYLAIEQVRFQDRLRIEMDIAPGATDALVPTLILQPLVENAIRHGISRRVQAGRIAIRARRTDEQLILEVEDDGPGLGSDITPSPGTGLGLRNTQARLQQLYGNDQSLELSEVSRGGALVTIRLPYRVPARSEALTS
jgi:two-component system LytT family sensor kinase